MRPIDADALMEKMKHRWERFGRESDCICLIEDAQTIDAVPVVRCGECKYYKDGMCYNPNTYDDDKTCGNTTADWFCADGERRTE